MYHYQQMDEKAINSTLSLMSIGMFNTTEQVIFNLTKHLKVP